MAQFPIGRMRGLLRRVSEGVTSVSFTLYLRNNGGEQDSTLCCRDYVSEGPLSDPADKTPVARFALRSFGV